jgi:hypothetical protein
MHAHPPSLYLSPPLELSYVVPSTPFSIKTSEKQLPVLCHIAPLPFSLDKNKDNEVLTTWKLYQIFVLGSKIVYQQSQKVTLCQIFWRVLSYIK